MSIGGTQRATTPNIVANTEERLLFRKAAKNSTYSQQKAMLAEKLVTFGPVNENLNTSMVKLRDLVKIQNSILNMLVQEVDTLQALKTTTESDKTK